MITKGSTIVFRKISEQIKGRPQFEVVPDEFISSESQNPNEQGTYLTVVVERHFRVTPVETFKVEELT